MELWELMWSRLRSEYQRALNVGCRLSFWTFFISLSPHGTSALLPIHFEFGRAMGNAHEVLGTICAPGGTLPPLAPLQWTTFPPMAPATHQCVICLPAFPTRLRTPSVWGLCLIHLLCLSQDSLVINTPRVNEQISV